MAGLALYRKYRSASFTEVLGQDHIVRALTQALASGQVSHAYLFTGPRGVGKTSVARLLAQSLNAAELSTIEIDAASNRSIDAIRDLREKVGLAPSRGEYKIYIIDEVHMLTTEAFNALLKTLEEPPSHVVFILATTEAHKIPETIASRTQRFAFLPITQEVMVQRLAYIAGEEKIQVEPEALNLIAEAARGSFRDAISLLDQLSTGVSDVVSVTRVRELLGFGDDTIMAALAKAISEGQTKAALEVLDALTKSGIQPSQLIAQLSQWWRQQLTQVVKGQGEFALPLILQTLESLVDAAKSPWPELSLEVALVKLSLSRAGSGATPQAPATPTSPAKEIPSSNSALEDLWPKAQAVLKLQNQGLYAVIEGCRTEFGDDTITLWSRFTFHRDRLRESKNRLILDRVLEKTYGRPITLKIEVEEAKAPPAPKPTVDLVSSALEILGGEIVDES